MHQQSTTSSKLSRTTHLSLSSCRWRTRQQTAPRSRGASLYLLYLRRRPRLAISITDLRNVGSTATGRSADGTVLATPFRDLGLQTSADFGGASEEGVDFFEGLAGGWRSGKSAQWPCDVGVGMWVRTYFPDIASRRMLRPGSNRSTARQR